MNDDRLQTMTDEQLQTAAMSLTRERNGALKEIEEAKARYAKVQSKLDDVIGEIGKRNYETMIQGFELTHDHVRLLKKYGAQVAEITDSDLQIAEALGWDVADTGLTERQETNIARLLAELKYAQDYINKYADGMVGMEKADK